MATTLRYGYEVRDAKSYFEDIPPLKLPDELVPLAEHILDTKTGHFDPAEFEDRYENAVVEMLKQKQAGMPVRKEAPVYGLNGEELGAINTPPKASGRTSPNPPGRDL